MFDCWIQEEEIENEGHQPNDIAACRSAFWDNLAIVQTAIAPKPVPVAEPVPAPEPVARDYLVFFDFDKTDIRADSASILDRVAEAMEERGSNSVTLVGHTDTMGPAEYNQTLSVGRAMAVVDYLKSKGIACRRPTRSRNRKTGASRSASTRISPRTARAAPRLRGAALVLHCDISRPHLHQRHAAECPLLMQWTAPTYRHRNVP
jgi:hypothetical protein